jgi:hypothetical protein
MAKLDKAQTARRPDWLRIADGVFLIGLGVFALLNASGRLAWSFWYDALAMWPILLVSVGLRMAVERTRMPWLAVLGPLVVLGIMAALATGRLESAPGPWRPVAAAREEGDQKLKLRPQFAASRLDVIARALTDGQLVDGRQGSREDKARVDVTRKDGTARVAFSMGNLGPASFLPGRTSRWELGVSNTLPLDIRVDGAMTGARFDLTQGVVEIAVVQGAFLGVDLRLPRPQAPVHLEVDGAFNVVDLYVPQGTPVRVSGTGFPFNLVDRGNGGDPKNPATPGYDVNIAGVFSRIGVTEGNAATRPAR